MEAEPKFSTTNFFAFLVRGEGEENEGLLISSSDESDSSHFEARFTFIFRAGYLALTLFLGCFELSWASRYNSLAEG